MYIVGVDIGGTFTDLITLNLKTQEQLAKKTLTTPSDPSIGVLNVFAEMLQDLKIDGGDVENVIHGTTLVTNTLIERKGAKTALIATKGFGDILEIGREWRYDIYDLFIEMPEPLVPRNLRFEVEERVLFDGSVQTHLNMLQAEGVIDLIQAEGVEAVAVCLLHSFMNDKHEIAIRDLIHEKMPDASVSLSCECIPEIREFERASTTVINAYTQPLTKDYLFRIQKRMEEHGYRKDSFFVMLSSGGITTREAAEKFPSRIAESGPAAGAICSAFLGGLKGKDSLLSFDMGGTTAKICLIEGGKPFVTTDFEVARIYRIKKGSGLPLKLPVIDMIEIGTGGGSMAQIDQMGLMKVGPESAGAEPGPVCYDLGGDIPTVTDGDLLLGYLNPDFFLGGRMKLNVEKAEQRIKEKLATPLGLTVTRAAYGIRQVADENMANAAAGYAAEKGLDYKDFTMIAFGGQGPIHAFTIGRLLGIREIIIPFRAGVASAFGLLVSPISFDFVRSYVSQLQRIDISYLNTIFQNMEHEAKSILMSAGVSEKKIDIVRKLDARYVGQGHEITISLPLGQFSKKSLKEISSTFEREYERIFHRVNPGVEIEGLNWRVVATGPRPITEIKSLSMREDQGSEIALKGKRMAYSTTTDNFVEFAVYDRYRLLPGMNIKGPAIIEETEATSIIGPDDSACVDEYLNLVVELGVFMD
ncbi:MAG: hydantoinase/oxoprolinase family protein [Desulfatiglandales bacterium]